MIQHLNIMKTKIFKLVILTIVQIVLIIIGTYLFNSYKGNPNMVKDEYVIRIILTYVCFGAVLLIGRYTFWKR